MPYTTRNDTKRARVHGVCQYTIPHPGKLLGGFEEKDDNDVYNILFKISEALSTESNEIKL